MDTKKRLYANFLLNRCLSMNAGEPLLLSYNVEQKDFVNIVKEEALKLGIKKIYEVVLDGDKTRDILLNSSLEEIEKNPYFNRKVIKDVYELGGSLLSLASYTKPKLDDVSTEKKQLINKINIDTQEDAIEARGKYKYPWCIAAVATKDWADELFPGEENNVEKLWNLIFDITLVNTLNPIFSWNEKIKQNTKRRNYLNDLKLSKLKYTNNLGTDLEVTLPNDVIWWGAAKKSFDGKKDLIVNMPTEEVYTSPCKNKTNGVVYSSRPLVVKGKVIDKFKLTFKDGKVIDTWASNDEDKLIELLDEFEGMRCLGECALVDYSSEISKTNMIFKSTLIDENASCHLALGRGFPKTIPNGEYMDSNELLKSGINQSKNHVDFMIGTKDLSIIGTDIYGNSVPIFVDGDFCEEKIQSFLKKRNN